MSKTSSERRAEINRRSALNLALLESFTRITVQALRYGFLVLIARYVYLSTNALAGKTTLAKIFVEFLGRATVSTALAWVLAICFGFDSMRQRQLRNREKRERGPRIKDLESRLDPARTSSKLDEHGHTPHST